MKNYIFFLVTIITTLVCSLPFNSTRENNIKLSIAVRKNSESNCSYKLSNLSFNNEEFQDERDDEIINFKSYLEEIYGGTLNFNHTLDSMIETLSNIAHGI